jgi:hypothetical protein
MPWAKTRASPIIHRFSLLSFAGVAARIGAGIVARLANILDIACIERLAITNSGPQRTRVSLC